MDTIQIEQTHKTAAQLLTKGRLKEAFDKIHQLISVLQDGYYNDRFENLQSNYRYMLQYYIDGVDDPERKTVYNRLIAKLFLLNEEIFEILFLQNSTKFVYSKKRYFSHTRKYPDFSALCLRLEELHAELDLLSKDESLHQEKILELRREYESLFYELFGSFWFVGQLKASEIESFHRIIAKDYPGTNEKALLVSALTLNLWRNFDEKKLMLLFDCCEAEEQAVKQRALVGLCFVLAKYNEFLSYFPLIRNRLVLIADNEHTLENFRNIIIQIIGSTETDKISKKLQEEILPEINKIGNKLKDKEDVENLLKSDDWEEMNPQWQEMIEDSGISDKLKELTDLQLEGADVYMSTFSLLKTFPFFSDIQNWFLPFDPNHSLIHSLFEKNEKNILNNFMNSQIMCNSDLYSFCLSVFQMPESQRDMLKKSLKMESEQLGEIKKDEILLSPNSYAKNISKQYIQDLFRFFKLFSQREEFENMFDLALGMHKTYLFDILSKNGDLKKSIAEYYFSKKLYKQSLDIFADELKNNNSDAALYQKIGYSHQQLSLIPEALEAYIKADIIQPDDIWTVKKIALCYRLLGNFEKAFEFYKHSEFLKPGVFATKMQIALCLFNLKKYKEALNIYFELEAKDEENIKIHRAIAWTMFVSKNIGQADYYIQKIINTGKATAQDYLNAGHIAWCMQRLKETISSYSKSWELQDKNWELFLEQFNNDIGYLESNGIDRDEITLMLDELRYNL